LVVLYHLGIARLGFFVQVPGTEGVPAGTDSSISHCYRLSFQITAQVCPRRLSRSDPSQPTGSTITVRMNPAPGA
jgi:hypothetical protein